MVKNGITVYARIKPETRLKRVNYEIHRRPKRHSNEDFLVINGREKFNEYDIDNRPESWKFSFHRIFEHDVAQIDIFESVARPIIDSVFDGYNATIFAYGQTGSGKTYTISGESEVYSEHGILPRTLQYVFDIVQKNPENLYTIEVAYLEIYNENGYDLLLKQEEREAAASRLEDLPATSETPMNPRSSRSHCIFTIVVSVKKIGEDRYTRAKMHLVDLAGSERVYKCSIQGTILNEAKHINLSLHFLEQVIVCLGQDNVSHVPYRNSLLTSILRDSLGGNCLTTMLATMSVSNFNMEETISTCRFAQRVALVKNDVNLTFEIDTKSENLLLKMENERLRREIEDLKKQQNFREETSESLNYYKDLVVQRDQEISRLMDILEKEKNKSTTKTISDDIRDVTMDVKYTQIPSDRSTTENRLQNSSNSLKIGRKIKHSRNTKTRTSPHKSESSEVREITFHSIKSSVPNFTLNDVQAELDLKIDFPPNEAKRPMTNGSIERHQLEIVKTLEVPDSINENHSEIIKSPETNDSIDINELKEIRTPQIPELNIRDNELLKSNEITNSVINEKKSQVENEFHRNIKKQTPRIDKFVVKVDNEFTNAEDLNNHSMDREALKVVDVEISKKILSCVKGTDIGTEKLEEIFSGRKKPKEKILEMKFPQKVTKMLHTSRNVSSDEEKSTSSIASASGIVRNDYKTLNTSRDVMCIEMNSPRLELDVFEDDKLRNFTEKDCDTKIDNIVRIPLPLTGDPDIDEEIIAFYKAKQTGNSY